MNIAEKGRRCVLVILLVLAAGFLRSSRISAAPTLEAVLTRAGQYVVGYSEKMPMLIGTERYAEAVELSGSSRTSRLLVSEFALVRTGNRWTAYRDVYDVDGRPLGEQKDRLEKLFAGSSPTSVTQARQLADESAKYYGGAIQRNFNTPTMALFFLRPDVQARFKFKKTGDDNIGGVSLWKIQYKESARPTIIMTSGGQEMPVSGTFWIDPADGSVFKSQMTIVVDARVADSGMGRGSGRRGGRGATPGRIESSVNVTVTYARDSHLDLLVPAEMQETYEAVNQGTTNIVCRATYEGLRRLEAGDGVPAPK